MTPSEVERDQASFQAICKIDDLRDGKCHPYSLGGRPLLLCRIGARVFAVENRCSHLAEPLEGGRLIGSRLICPFHGAAFDISSGSALSGPAVGSIASFPVDVRNEMIFVSNEPVLQGR